MIFGLDTSVLLRLLTGEPESSCAKATRRLLAERRRESTVIATDIAIAEAYFALKHHYGAAPDVIRKRLFVMLTSGLVEPEAGSAVLDVLRDEQGGSAGFVDRLIHARYRKAGATTLTMDKAQSKLEGAEWVG